MSLQQITNKNLIAVNCDFTTKNEVITFLVDRLAAEGKLKDRDAFMQAVMDREALSETGVDSGIAIPHGKSEAVREAAVAICRVNAPIADWESMEEDNQVTLIFLLAIPVAEAGSTHLDLLAELMTHAQDEAFLGRLMHAATVDEMYDALNVEKKDAAADPAKTYTHMVVAVTACPAGIAHTYMAAEALAPGFAAGVAANLIGGGFLCGMLSGLVAGYSVRWLRKTIPAKGTLAGFVSFWVYPVLSTIMVGVALFLLVGKPVAAINAGLISLLSSMSGSNGALLGAVLGIMVSFDLGGPVNKAAYTF